MDSYNGESAYEDLKEDIKDIKRGYKTAKDSIDTAKKIKNLTDSNSAEYQLAQQLKQKLAEQAAKQMATNTAASTAGGSVAGTTAGTMASTTGGTVATTGGTAVATAGGGAVSGAASGSVVPVLGTIIGAVIGLVAGGVASKIKQSNGNEDGSVVTISIASIVALVFSPILFLIFIVVLCGTILSKGIDGNVAIHQETEFQEDYMLTNGEGVGDAGHLYEEDSRELDEYNFTYPLNHGIQLYIYGPPEEVEE